MKVLEALDRIAFGIAANSTKATVTIELDRKAAERAIWEIGIGLDSYLKEFNRESPFIQLGTVFQYRGVNFRIVEIA